MNVDSLRRQLRHCADDLVVGLRNAFGVEILADFVRHVVIAGVLQVMHHDRKRVAVGFGAGKAELFRGPQTQHLVAPRGRLELEVLIVRELLFEGFFAPVECGHGLRLFLRGAGWETVRIAS
jgi:hypothetical protein